MPHKLPLALACALSLACSGSDTTNSEESTVHQPAEETTPAAPQAQPFVPSGELMPDTDRTVAPATPTPISANAVVADPCVQRAEDAARSLGQSLKMRLMAEMARGPRAAAQVCANEAEAIRSRIAEATHVRIGRAGTRTRNPANRPPSFAAAWLAGSDHAPLRAKDGQTAHVALPIVTEAMCLTCHGSDAQIPADVKALFAERYPSDAATGYSEGELRGVLWAEASCTD